MLINKKNGVVGAISSKATKLKSMRLKKRKGEEKFSKNGGKGGMSKRDNG